MPEGSCGFPQEIYDIERGSRSRLTTKGHSNTPVWTPDGQRITWASIRGGSETLYSKPADGSGEAVSLSTHQNGQFPNEWSPDGKVLVYTVVPEGDSPTGIDIWVLPSDGGEPSPLLATSSNESAASFSPDGRCGWSLFPTGRGRTRCTCRPIPTLGVCIPSPLGEGRSLFGHPPEGSFSTET